MIAVWHLSKTNSVHTVTALASERGKTLRTALPYPLTSLSTPIPGRVLGFSPMSDPGEYARSRKRSQSRLANAVGAHYCSSSCSQYCAETAADAQERMASPIGQKPTRYQPTSTSQMTNANMAEATKAITRVCTKRSGVPDRRSMPEICPPRTTNVLSSSEVPIVGAQTFINEASTMRLS